MARAPRANKKKLEQAELKELNAIQITIVASEINLQRLAALLMFAEHLEPKFVGKEAGPMPWEEPQLNPLPAGQDIEPAAVQRAIAKELETYVANHGRDAVIALLASFGGEKLSSVPHDQLLGMLAALETANA